jgi:hypothetical protein
VFVCLEQCHKFHTRASFLLSRSPALNLKQTLLPTLQTIFGERWDQVTDSDSCITVAEGDCLVHAHLACDVSYSQALRVSASSLLCGLAYGCTSIKVVPVTDPIVTAWQSLVVDFRAQTYRVYGTSTFKFDRAAYLKSLGGSRRAASPVGPRSPSASRDRETRSLPKLGTSPSAQGSKVLQLQAPHAPQLGIPHAEQSPSAASMATGRRKRKYKYACLQALKCMFTPC